MHDINSAFSFVSRNKQADMSHPMTTYYMNSSHNTYAAEDQLFGESSVDMYNYAINEGCRCFELDLYDGPDEPKITHGNTLMTNIKFSQVLKVLCTNSFEHNPYPICLSLENHLSKEMQIKMKEMFLACGRPIFMIDEANPPKVYPSPEELKYHLILKFSRTRINAKNSDVLKHTEKDEDEEEGKREGKDESKDKKSKKMEKVKNTCPEIFDIIGMIAVKLHLDNIDEHEYKPWECGNILEKKSYKYVTDPNLLPSFAKLNINFFTKSYPDGLRFDSSNFNPIPSWTIGCQVVALNIQTPDINYLVNKFMFQYNRNTGFVRKPDRLLKSSTFDELYPQTRRFTLDIELIAGSYLRNLIGDVGSSLYFTFALMGNTNDNLNKIYKSAEIKENFLKVVFTNESFVLDVFDEDLSFLIVEAFVDESLCARACVPVRFMSFGIRNISFVDKSFKAVLDSSLLLQITKTNI